MDPSYYPYLNERLILRNEVTNETRAVMEELNEMFKTMNNGWTTEVKDWPMDSHQVISPHRNR